MLTHTNQLDHVYQTKMLEKRQLEAKVLMTDFLTPKSHRPQLPNRLSRRSSQWSTGQGEGETFKISSIKSSPTSFSQRSMDPCEVFRLLEKD